MLNWRPGSFWGSFLALLILANPAAAQDSTISHGQALIGDLKYGPDFAHLEYVNPDAPRGGTLRMATTIGFDSLNPFIIKGTAAAGMGLLYQSLTEPTSDEPSGNSYGVLAESIETANDGSWVAFTLRENARWHDGNPITVEDVIFTFDLLIEKGQPLYKQYYRDVEPPVQSGERTVKFGLKDPKNRELAAIVGQLLVLPKHYWQDRDFEAASLDPPLGSGPYRVEKVDAGRSITFVRVEDFWADDLPLMKGRYNWGRVRYDVYRDSSVLFEAFKSGSYDFRREYVSKNWATAYDFPAVKEGYVVQETRPKQGEIRLQAYIFNLRRAKFQDPKVRQAIGLAFDFEWNNKTLYYGLYRRSTSYFPNSELAATGIPEGKELAYLEPYRDQLPPALFEKPFELPQTNGSGSDRRAIRQAKTLLEEAGWFIKDGKLTHQDSGEVMTLEFLYSQSNLDRPFAHFKKNLERLGVEVKLRLVDTSQFIRRMDEFDFDFANQSWFQSLSPGNEQRSYFGSAAADQRASRNTAGIKNPVVDALIQKIVEAPDRESLVAATRAMDRVLLWNYYVVPQQYAPDNWLAYWNKFGQPETKPGYGTGFFDSWWIDPELAAALEKSGAQQQ